MSNYFRSFAASILLFGAIPSLAATAVTSTGIGDSEEASLRDAQRNLLRKINASLENKSAWLQYDSGLVDALNTPAGGLSKVEAKSSTEGGVTTTTLSARVQESLLNTSICEAVRARHDLDIRVVNKDSFGPSHLEIISALRQKLNSQCFILRVNAAQTLTATVQVKSKANSGLFPGSAMDSNTALIATVLTTKGGRIKAAPMNSMVFLGADPRNAFTRLKDVPIFTLAKRTVNNRGKGAYQKLDIKVSEVVEKSARGILDIQIDGEVSRAQAKADAARNLWVELDEDIRKEVLSGTVPKQNWHDLNENACALAQKKYDLRVRLKAPKGSMVLANTAIVDQLLLQCFVITDDAKNTLEITSRLTSSSSQFGGRVKLSSVNTAASWRDERGTTMHIETESRTMAGFSLLNAWYQTVTKQKNEFKSFPRHPTSSQHTKQQSTRVSNGELLTYGLVRKLVKSRIKSGR